MYQTIVRWLGMTLLLVVLEPVAQAQFITFDAINNIIHQAMQYLQDPSFKALVKGVEDLSKIAGSVRQFHRGYEAVENISKCTQKISTISQLAQVDGHITNGDYQAIGSVLKEFNTEASAILKDARAGLSGSAGSVVKMEDGARMEWIDKIATKTQLLNNKLDGLLAVMKRHSMSRSFTRNDMNATAHLYGVAITRANRVATRSGSSYAGGNPDIYGDAGYVGGYSTDGYANNENAKANQASLARYRDELEKYQIQMEIYNERIGVEGGRWLLTVGGYHGYFDKDKMAFNGYQGPDGTVYTDDQMARLSTIKGRELFQDDPNKPKAPAPPNLGR